MAKEKNGQSISAIFRQYFEEHPELLREPTNQKVYEMYQKDHPNRPFTKSEQNVCANVKSQMRKEKGIRKRGRKKAGRKVKAVGAHRTGAVAAPSVSTKTLESLEIGIDRCLNEARDASLSDVIKHLRRARVSVSQRLIKD
ncbi:MAG TPA: hypothetical protein VIL46_17805 [Gemmataceae bacterium]